MMMFGGHVHARLCPRGIIQYALARQGADAPTADLPLSAPDASTKASCAPIPSNLLGFGRKVVAVSALTSPQNAESKPAGALSPVPTAVPPWGSRQSRGRAASLSVATAKLVEPGVLGLLGP